MPSTNDRLKDVLRELGNPAWVCLLWCGLTAGVTLLAIPGIFQAESLARKEALDTARTVFELLAKAEFVLLVLFLILVRTSSRASALWAWCGFLALIMIAQGAWLIPELAARTDIVLSGGEPPPSHAHAIYSTLELAKIGLLLFLGFRSLGESR